MTYDYAYQYTGKNKKVPKEIGEDDYKLLCDDQQKLYKRIERDGIEGIDFDAELAVEKEVYIFEERKAIRGSFIKDDDSAYEGFEEFEDMVPETKESIYGTSRRRAPFY